MLDTWSTCLCTENVIDPCVCFPGIGEKIDMNELTAIASDPVCLHLFLLKDFSEVESLKYAIEKKTCEGWWQL